MSGGEGRSRGRSFHDLPLELLCKCISHVDDKDRCNSIALVSHTFLKAHMDTPPRKGKVWAIDCQKQPMRRGMLMWFSRIAADLEELEIHNLADKGATCLLPELLVSAATAAPKLHTLRLENSSGLGVSPVVRCQAVLEQIGQLQHLGLLRLCGSNPDVFLPPFKRALTRIVDWRTHDPMAAHVRVQLEGVQGRGSNAQNMYNCMLL